MDRKLFVTVIARNHTMGEEWTMWSGETFAEGVMLFVTVLEGGE